MTHKMLDVPVQNPEEALANLAGGQAAAIPILPVTHPLARRGSRWGLVLAGGSGVRLRPLTRKICGDDRPKQFCRLFGGRTLLDQTLWRLESIVPPEQILVSLSGQHSSWYTREAGLRASQRVVQPLSRGTAPPILHSLLSLAQLDPEALVAILPCDHYYSNEQLFGSTLECAFQTASERTDSIVLLGARPDYPEVEYGWIDLGSRLGHHNSELFRVRGFCEKPALDLAQSLLERGSLWSTFVMVGHMHAFLQAVQATLPDLLSMLRAARMWKGTETHIEYPLYDRVPSVSFSERVLSAAPARFVVLRLNEIGWRDLGNPQRALIAARESKSAFNAHPHPSLSWG